MKKRMFAAALAASFGMSGLAFADGMPNRAPKYIGPDPVVAPATSWTGFYVGFGIGAGAVNHDLKASEVQSATFNELIVAPPPLATAEVDGLGGQGVLGTVTVGYDRQYGNYVAGVFFDYDFTNIGSTIRVSNVANANVDLNDMWSLGGRVGYLVNPNTLAYVLAAYTEANFDIPSGFKNGTFSGVSVGAGLETQLGGNWFLKGEYRFTSLDKETVYETGTLKVTDEPDIHTARLVLSYKFNALDGDYLSMK